MNDDKKRDVIIDMIKKQTAKISVSKETARTFLLKSGIYTKAGLLSPEYGGRRKKGKTAA